MIIVWNNLDCIYAANFFIGIVWFRVPDVHTERVTLLHNLDDMTHHTHPMKTGLSIEKHRIAIHHMTMDDVAIFQFNG